MKLGDPPTDLRPTSRDVLAFLIGILIGILLMWIASTLGARV